ncbi:ATP-binding protein [Streptomyces sp. Y7]|uniref:ATP-binding protein n=1 Tax=Streptomyces sp. Y7 TaxID=3342392 RepID=UPI00371A664A
MLYGSYPQPPLGAGHLSVEYDPRPTAVGEARAEVRRQLEGWGLADLDLADMAERLVSDLAANALRQAAESRFRLTLSAAHGTLRCEVRDGVGKTVWFELGTCRCAPGLVVGGSFRGAD